MSQKLSASTMVQERCSRFSGFENPKSNGAMRQLLWLVVVHGLLTPVQSVNGVMWNKKISDFVPIVSEPIFAAMNQEILDRSRAKETHRFQGRTFRIAYYEIMNVITSDKNGTSIKGYIGDTWKILAEYLHFTLKPERSIVKTIGVKVNGTYSPGLLKMIVLNQTDIIARVEASPSIATLVQLTVPFRKASCRIFTQQKQKHVTTWMLKLFSREVWFATLATYIILSICSYIFRVIEVDVFGGNMIPDILDSLFYNLGMMCIQSCNTNAVSKSSKMIECLVNLFALLINAVFNALVIGYVTQVIDIKPFFDIMSLLYTSEYIPVVMNGTFMHIKFQEVMVSDHLIKRKSTKFIVKNSLNECYKTICTKELTAVYAMDEINIRIKAPCKLQFLGGTLRLPISSAISWNVENKRSIDIGLLKLHEIGLLNAIQQNWLMWGKEEANEISQMPTAIELEQMYLVYLLFLGGMLMSVIILILEQIAFHYNK